MGSDIFAVGKSWLIGMDKAAADYHLAQTFEHLGGASQGSAATVPVSWGRKFNVREQRNGVARFQFNELCGLALSPDDYLALAHHFHTFLIADVPKFSVNQHNEARRFTNLVDVLYEQNSRLICSAAAEPGGLLGDMEALLEVSLDNLAVDADGQAIDEGSIAWEGNPWVRKDPFAKDLTVEEALKAAQSGLPLGGSKVGVAGVLAPAIASLHESGFASRRAISRMRHMQTAEYIEVHRCQYLA